MPFYHDIVFQDLRNKGRTGWSLKLGLDLCEVHVKNHTMWSIVQYNTSFSVGWCFLVCRLQYEFFSGMVFSCLYRLHTVDYNASFSVGWCFLVCRLQYEFFSGVVFSCLYRLHTVDYNASFSVGWCFLVCRLQYEFFSGMVFSCL